jgi:Fic family protein
MTWNWQKDTWPTWEFDVSSLQKYENEFLLTAGKLSWSLAYLQKGEREKLEVVLLSDEAMKTSEIEGEFLDRDSVQSSIKRKFGMQTDRKSKAAETWIAELMMDCFQNYENALTGKTFFRWHTMVCKGRGDIHDLWKYRTHSEPMQVVSWQIDRPKIHFEAIASDKVPREMKEFLAWMNNSQLSPLVKAGVAHMYFISIHPFEDGNGRIVRAICEHVLSHALNMPSLTTLSRQIEIKRKEYYDILEKSNKDMNIQVWLEWFCITVLQAQKYALNLVEFTIKKTKILDSVRGNINERQHKVLIRMFEAWPEGFIGGLSASNYIRIAGSTVPTTTRDLNDLVEKWVLLKFWALKSTRYYLNIK